MTFLLNVIDNGEVHVPLAKVIVAVELLITTPRRPNVLPTVTFDGTVCTLRTLTPFIWTEPVLLDVLTLLLLFVTLVLLFLTAKTESVTVGATISVNVIITTARIVNPSLGSIIIRYLFIELGSDLDRYLNKYEVKAFKATLWSIEKVYQFCTG
jgi:hypothetical protein